MGPWPPTVGRFWGGVFRALAAIQAHRRIERVEAPLAGERDIKSGAGKALKDVREGDGAGVNKFNISKNNFINLMSLIIQS